MVNMPLITNIQWCCELNGFVQCGSGIYFIDVFSLRLNVRCSSDITSHVVSVSLKG